ncbi:MAG: 30S ribosomal protein S15 [Pseudanabaenaceae cyanobacterium]|jgi:small subunit ribosomal protein S15
MALLQERKQEIMSVHQKHATDTGSSDVQVALMSERIIQLTTHLKVHPKDYASRRSLLKLIGQRKCLLAYIRKNSVAHYKELIQKLNIRG